MNLALGDHVYSFLRDGKPLTDSDAFEAMVAILTKHYTRMVVCLTPDGQHVRAVTVSNDDDYCDKLMARMEGENFVDKELELMRPEGQASTTVA